MCCFSKQLAKKWLNMKGRWSRLVQLQSLITVLTMSFLSLVYVFYPQNDNATLIPKVTKATNSISQKIAANNVSAVITDSISMIPIAKILTDEFVSEATALPVLRASKRLHAVTYASHGGRDDRFCRAVESALRNDIDLVILGWGLKWLGLSQKLEAAHNYAKSISPDDIMLFTDAFDVLFASSANYIQDSFLEQGNKIIFSAECGCWPHIMENRNICLKEYPISPTPYRYLNSGTWIGYAAAASIMLEEVIREAGKNFQNANDQKLIADMYIAGRHDIKLDFYNKFFQSMHMTLDPPLPHCNPMEDISLSSDRRHWINKRTLSTPAIFHFNGGGKVHHLEMEGQIWYKMPAENTHEKIALLAERKISVPTSPGGFMRFDELCKNYLPPHH